MEVAFKHLEPRAVAPKRQATQPDEKGGRTIISTTSYLYGTLVATWDSTSIKESSSSIASKARSDF